MQFSKTQTPPAYHLDEDHEVACFLFKSEIGS
jgi:hypothetical protein